jgi:hypothetical protein
MPIATAPPSTLDNVTVTSVRRLGNKDHNLVISIVLVISQWSVVISQWSVLASTNDQ